VVWGVVGVGGVGEEEEVEEVEAFSPIVKGPGEIVEEKIYEEGEEEEGVAGLQPAVEIKPTASAAGEAGS
jgi:hypothetical protein